MVRGEWREKKLKEEQIPLPARRDRDDTQVRDDTRIAGGHDESEEFS